MRDELRTEMGKEWRYIVGEDKSDTCREIARVGLERVEIVHYSSTHNCCRSV